MVCNPQGALLRLEPSANCDGCPRLAEFRSANRAKFADFRNAPVPSFGGLDSWLLVVGLAPGLKGANRTGRPFTGDYAGDLLYKTLTNFGMAQGLYRADPNDGLTLSGCRITNAVRCVPPENKVTGAEVKTCGEYLSNEMANMPNLKALFVLGTVAHGAVLAALKARKSAHPFGHGKVYTVADKIVGCSYHCSRYNTNTGRLTEAMFVQAFSNLLTAAGKG